MWDFLNNLLEKAGVVAALYALTLVGIGAASRWLWGQWTKTLAAHSAAIKAEEVKRGEMRVAFEVERREMREAHTGAMAREAAEHAAELLAVAEQRRAEAERFGARLDAVRDHHTEQMVGLVEKSTRHIERIDQSVAKLGAGLDVLIRIGEGGR